MLYMYIQREKTGKRSVDPSFVLFIIFFIYYLLYDVIF